MSTNQSKIQVLEEIEPDSLLQYQSGTAIEISFKSNSEPQQEIMSNQYPSISNGSASVQRKSQDSSNRNSQDQLNQVVKGVKRSSYDLEDLDSNSVSFSGLNYSLKEEDPVKSNLKSKLKEVKEEKKDPPSSAQMKMLNQSIFTSKFKPNKIVNRDSESPEKQPQDAANYERSFYMSQKPTISQKSQMILKQKQKAKIEVKFISKGYILEYKGETIQANKQSLHNLYHELFKKQIFVPKFNSQRYDEWQSMKDENKYQLQCDVHMNYKIYLQRYVQYLNQTCLEQVEDALKKVTQQGRVEKKNLNEGFSIFNLDFNSLFQNLKHFMSSSKYEVLRKTLLSKIKSMKEMLKVKQNWKMTPEEEKVIRKTIQMTWKDLGQVELLRNFEQTEQYCKKQMQSSSQLKFKQIWIKYRDANRKQKNRISAKIDSIYL